MMITKRHLSVAIAAVMICLTAVMPGPAAAESAPPPEEKQIDWSEEVVESESGIYYTVKKGDTLWDLSQKFSDSPYLWPDLWSQNDQIANPHLIYPGQRIMLYRRSDLEQHAEPIETAAPIEVEPEPFEPPVIETPEIEPAPEPPRGYFFTKMDQVGFIREDPVEPHGKIFRVRDGRKMIATEDIVYVSHQGDHLLNPGQRYTVYRTIGPIKDPATRRPIGMQHYLLGILEVAQAEPDFAVARVLRAFTDMRVGDLLMPYEPRSPEIPNRSSVPDLQGELIKTNDGRQLIGDHVLAFINRGEKDGVAPGQRYSIFFQATDRIDARSRAEKQLNRVIFGELLVVHTEKTTATVYITDAESEIKSGASFCTPF